MRTSVKMAIFCGVVVVVFVVLFLLTIPRGLSVADLQHAADQIAKLDRALVAREVPWSKVQLLYDSKTARVVADTDRFEDNMALNFKVEDAIKEGQAAEYPAIPAVILRRTLLRAMLYHLDALLEPKTKVELAMSHAERAERATVVVRPLLAFADEETPGASALLEKALQDWRKSGNPTAAAKVRQFTQTLFASGVLKRLAQWQALPDKAKQNRLAALALQADMRQLYSYLYPVHAKKDKATAWRILTEFTNQPSEVDAELIEKGISAAFGVTGFGFEKPTVEGVAATPAQ